MTSNVMSEKETTRTQVGPDSFEFPKHVFIGVQAIMKKAINLAQSLQKRVQEFLRITDVQ